MSFGFYLQCKRKQLFTVSYSDILMYRLFLHYPKFYRLLGIKFATTLLTLLDLNAEFVPGPHDVAPDLLRILPHKPDVRREAI